MRRIRLFSAALLGCAVMAIFPAAALAISPVLDCRESTTNSLSEHYTIKQLQHALKTMSTTVAEYSNCEQVISTQLRKQLAASPHKPDRGQGGSSTVGAGSIIPVALIVVVVLIVTGGGFLYSRRRGGGGVPGDSPPPGA